LAASALAGAELALCALALTPSSRRPAAALASRFGLPGRQRAADRRELQRLIPPPWPRRSRCSGQAPVGARGRRIACSGDIAGAGGEGERLHRTLAAQLAAAKIDLVFCWSVDAHALGAIPTGRAGRLCETAAALEPAVLAPSRTAMR